MHRLLIYVAAIFAAAVLFATGFFSGSMLTLHNQDTSGWRIFKSDMLLTTGAHISLVQTYKNNPAASAQLLRTLLEGYQMKRMLLNSPSDKLLFSETDKNVLTALNALPLPSPSPLPSSIETKTRTIIRVKPEQGAAANP